MPNTVISSYHGFDTRKNYGAPTSRNRIYILLIRRELLLGGEKANFKNMAKNLSEKLRIEAKVKWKLDGKLFI